jgi:hypothetical protein
MDDLGSMFEDLSFETLQSAPSAAPQQQTNPVAASKLAMMTLRGVGGVNIDDLILNEQTKKKTWKGTFALGDECEALYDADGQWYVAKIDTLLDEPLMYAVTFTEYGNSQDTEESKIRFTLGQKMSKAAAQAQVDADKKSASSSRPSKNSRIPQNESHSSKSLSDAEKRRASDNSSSMVRKRESFSFVVLSRIRVLRLR